MKRFVIGDIHGNIKALKQCLERSNFNKEKDKLIVLGDTCDGWQYVKDCFNELLKIKNLVHVMGNHDLWALSWYDGADYGVYPDEQPEYLWYRQGGSQTIHSYDNKKMDDSHIELLRNSPFYHIEDNMLFVHGGIDEDIKVEDTNHHDLIWNRDLYYRVRMVHPVNKDYKIQDWDTIFIGHTQTGNKHLGYEPKFYCNVINLDQGAGWDGKLTIMDIDTKEYWQSDLTSELYPNEIGRR